MVPQSGQEYHAVNKLLGTQAQENWIITERVPSRSARQKNPRSSKNKTEMPSREPAKKPPASEDASPAKVTDPALEEKLQFLKDLHEKNLIDEKEYDQKRKELLDTYL